MISFFTASRCSEDFAASRRCAICWYWERNCSRVPSLISPPLCSADSPWPARSADSCRALRVAHHLEQRREIVAEHRVPGVELQALADDDLGLVEGFLRRRREGARPEPHGRQLPLAGDLARAVEPGLGGGEVPAFQRG